MIRLFRVFIPASVVALLITEVLLVIACYVAALYLLHFELQVDPAFYLFDENNYWKLGLLTGLIVLGLYFQDLYASLRIRSRILLVQQVCLAVGCALLAAAFMGYIQPNILMGRWLMMLGSLLVIIMLPLWRVFFWTYVLVGFRSERVLLLGNSSILGDVIERLLHRPEFGYTVLGYLCEDEPCDFPIVCLGRMRDVRSVCEEHRPTRIVVGMEERRNRMPYQDLLDIRFGGIVIEDVADTYEMAMQRVCTRKIQPSQLIFSSMLGPRRQALALQKLYSWVLGITGLIVASPLMLLTWIAVKATSPGPAFYRQRRVGMEGKVFTVYKFRSMYVDAEARTGAVWASKDDPRITPLGRWLRKLRLDELPQFWNVVKSDMAIVGPRPERPEFVEMLAQQIPYYRQRLAVRPGITGWAQINHKYGDTQLDAMIKLEYDLYYIKNLAPALDFYIIFHTIKVMLLSRGAQ
ncbi:MAG TPA: sugar transferase [Bryobacteraceae bacterium]